jgi:hypothetical protein
VVKGRVEGDLGSVVVVLMSGHMKIRLTLTSGSNTVLNPR